MSRINLIISTNPGQAEIVCNLQNIEGAFERITAMVDTGAEVSFFPIGLLPRIAHDETSRETVEILQAGMAEQRFEAIQCTISVFFEDIEGNQTQPFAIPAWFGNTRIALIGIAGVIDKGVLHLDMPTLTGYLEIEA